MLHQIAKKRLATFHHIIKCLIKISCIPWICNVSRTICVIQKSLYLVLRVISDDSHNVLYIVSLHADDVVECGIFFSTHLACTVIATRDSFLAELLLCAAVNWVSMFFIACTGGIDEEIGFYSIEKSSRFCVKKAALIELFGLYLYR